MGLTTLDGAALSLLWRAGLHRLLARSEHLDRINVFPVADGDTGTNLAMTTASVLAVLDRIEPAHAGELMARIADAALDGARGNSGAILAQFLLGVADRLATRTVLSPQDFAAAIASGATYARDALTEPREGTILTVLAEFGRELARLASPRPDIDFRVLIPETLPALRTALEGTRTALPELRDANVVDAGAQGFVDIVEGMTNWLRTGEIEPLTTQHVTTDEAMAGATTHGTERWCTECMIAGDALDARRLRENVAAFGSSLVVAGTPRKLRVHVHTNDPERVFEVAAGFGAVSGQKADDMYRQQDAAHHSRSRRVAIVTDSAADLPDDVLESHDLHVVPLRVHFGERSFLDKVSLSPDEFYRELASNPIAPKTSQPPPGDFRRAYEFLASHYESVLCIAVTAKASGTWSAAQLAAERVPGGRVRVIDSHNASLGEGLLATYAAECAAAGWPLDRIVAAVEAARPRTRTFALLRRLDYAVRGGRVAPIVGNLSRWLRFSPVLTNRQDGRVVVDGAVFGRSDLVGKFARYVQKRLDPQARYRIVVGYADVRADGEALRDAVIAGADASRDRVSVGPLARLGTALGVHGGPGLLVIGVQELD